MSLYLPPRDAARVLLQTRFLKSWDPEKHPRDAKGQWATVGVEQEIGRLSAKYPEVKQRLQQFSGTSAGSVLKHTQQIGRNWEKQIGQKELEGISSRWGSDIGEVLKTGLVLHDIGKGEAVALKAKHLQHTFTEPVLRDTMEREGFSARDIDLATELFNHDLLGEAVQSQYYHLHKAPDATRAGVGVALRLREKAQRLGMDPADFATLQLAVYHADASSYASVRKQMAPDLTGRLRFTGKAAQAVLEPIIRLAKTGYVLHTLRSGNFGHAGRPGHVGGSAPSASGSAVAGTGVADRPRTERSQRALDAFVPIGADGQRHAENNELEVRRLIRNRATRTDDNLPVDVIVTLDGKVKGVEVKTMINNTRDQITMRKAAIEKKDKWARQNHASTHTVVIDDRGRLGHPSYSGHRLYYAKGHGSFRLGGMTKVENAEHLQSLLRGQTQRAAETSPLSRLFEFSSLYRRFRSLAGRLVGGDIDAAHLALENHARRRREDPTKTISTSALLIGAVAWDESKHPRDDRGRFAVADIVGGQKVGGQQGSNPGGTYLAKDGSKWYVKSYHDSNQAYGEHLANRIYRDLGVGAPNSTVGQVGGKTYYASSYMEGKGTIQNEGLTQDVANKVLDGFAADAFLGNWDAVGTGLDNVLIHQDGSVSRIDNGGSLLHRAMGSLKDEKFLPKVGEWESLVQASYYGKMFKAAGYKNGDALGSRAVGQIDQILAVREKAGGWAQYIDRTIPDAPKAYREKLAKVLELRTVDLQRIRERLSTRTMAAEWDEAEHPRDDDGKFTDKGGGAKSDDEQIAQMAHQGLLIEAAKMWKSNFSGTEIEQKTGIKPLELMTYLKEESKPPSKKEIATELKTIPTAPEWPVSNKEPREMPSEAGYQLLQRANPWIHSLSPMERASLADYAQDGYVPINRTLRDGGSDDQTDAITAALERAPTPPPPQLVWRGISRKTVGRLNVQGLAVGDQLKLDGFQSTTVDPALAANWGTGIVMLEILPKQGGYISEIGSPGEYEFLLPHGRTYTVRGLSKVTVRNEDQIDEEKLVLQLEMNVTPAEAGRQRFRERYKNLHP